jgi:hypothetical protein
MSPAYTPKDPGVTDFISGSGHIQPLGKDAHTRENMFPAGKKVAPGNPEGLK